MKRLPWSSAPIVEGSTKLGQGQSAQWEAYAQQQHQEEETRAKKREAARKQVWQFFERYPEMYTPKEKAAIMLNLHRPEVQAELDQRMKQQEQKKQQQEWEKARQWIAEKQEAGRGVVEMFDEASDLPPEMYEKVVHMLQ